MKADWCKPVILTSFFFLLIGLSMKKMDTLGQWVMGRHLLGTSHDNETIKNGVNMVKMIEKTYAKNLGQEAIALLLNQLISRGNACSLLSHLMEFSVMYS